MSASNIYHHFKSFCTENNIVNYSSELGFENISFLKTQLDVKEDTHYKGKMPIQGLSFFYEQQDIKLMNKKNKLSINTVNNCEGNVLLSKGEITTSSITLKKDFLLKSLPEGKVKENIIESLETNRYGKLLAKKDINPQVQLLLNNIYNNPFTNQLDKLYAQSKILELIYLEFQSHIDIEPTKNNKLKLDQYDIEAIKKAKEILIQNMQNPPSIVELSHMVRINEFKLKVGFKIVFNDTPYNILLHHKLEYASELLKNSDMSAGEVARLSGYKSLSSFTKAFIKKHGVRPIDIMKSRKYYY